MRYLKFAIFAWIVLWAGGLSYIIWDGGLQTAYDKGQLHSAWTLMALVLIVMPLLAYGAGRMVQWLVSARR